MHYFDNPGGLIPSWLINWGAKVCIVKLFTDCSFSERPESCFCQGRAVNSPR